jgi:protocatechuate 3,4-dioxygenase beta subunit
MGCAPPQSASTAREPIVGLPCEGCDAVFDGMPALASIPTSARVAPENEPGTPLVVRGVVRAANGAPIEGVVVYAYQTDDAGLYPTHPVLRNTPGARHGRLRGWVRTDRGGAYEFVTIRPGSYPDRIDPEHIHLHVLEPGRCTYYIDDVLFEDDPLLTESWRRGLPNRGGPGNATPSRNDDGPLLVTRDITLGMNIPGYPAR